MEEERKRLYQKEQHIGFEKGVIRFPLGGGNTAVEAGL